MARDDAVASCRWVEDANLVRTVRAKEEDHYALAGSFATCTTAEQLTIPLPQSVWANEKKRSLTPRSAETASTAKYHRQWWQKNH